MSGTRAPAISTRPGRSSGCRRRWSRSRSSASTRAWRRPRAASARAATSPSISKSGSNRFNGSLFNYLRNDAMDSASKYDDKKQQLEFNQFGGSIGGPIADEQDLLLRQLRGPEADDRPQLHRGGAERRGDSADPGGRAGRQRAAARARRARRPWRRCWPASRTARSRPPTRCWRSPRSRRRPSRKSTAVSVRLDHRFTNNQSFVRCACSTATATSTRRIGRSRRGACTPTQQPLNVVFNHQSIVRHERDQRSEGRFQPAEVRARSRSDTPGLRPDAGLALRHRDLAVDRRARLRPASRAAACSSAPRATRRPTARPTTRGRSPSATR